MLCCCLLTSTTLVACPRYGCIVLSLAEILFFFGNLLVDSPEEPTNGNVLLYRFTFALLAIVDLVGIFGLYLEHFLASFLYFSFQIAELIGLNILFFYCSVHLYLPLFILALAVHCLGTLCCGLYLYAGRHQRQAGIIWQITLPTCLQLSQMLLISSTILAFISTQLFALYQLHVYSGHNKFQITDMDVFAIVADLTYIMVSFGVVQRSITLTGAYVAINGLINLGVAFEMGQKRLDYAFQKCVSITLLFNVLSTLCVSLYVYLLYRTKHPDEEDKKKSYSGV